MEVSFVLKALSYRPVARLFTYSDCFSEPPHLTGHSWFYVLNKRDDAPWKYGRKSIADRLTTADSVLVWV